MLSTSTCYHHFLQTVGAPDITLCETANCQQPTANSQSYSHNFTFPAPLTPERTNCFDSLSKLCSRFGRLDASRRALPSLGNIGASSILLSLLAGLLTFPSLPYLPDFKSVALYRQTLQRGITAAGTVPDSHRIPLHQVASATRLPYFCLQRYNFF